jgi:hypothetical protein
MRRKALLPVSGVISLASSVDAKNKHVQDGILPQSHSRRGKSLDHNLN